MEYITGTCVINEQAVYRNGEKIAAISDLPALYQHFNWQYPKFYKMDNLSRLGWAAAELLLEGWDTEAYQPEEVAIVLSNANSSLDTDYRYTATTKDIPSPSVFVYTLPNIVTGEICIRHGFKGENAFFVSDNFNASFIGNYVSNLLDNGNLQACICGWVDFIGNDYKAALFLVEKTSSANALPFTAENMDKLFEDKVQQPEIFVAGLGVISAIGNNVTETLASFEKEHAGMGDISIIDTIHKGGLPVA